MPRHFTSTGQAAGQAALQAAYADRRETYRQLTREQGWAPWRAQQHMGISVRTRSRYETQLRTMEQA